ncbi:LysM peptidoglycan-binding domain-containing protein [Variovorax sp. PAMC26660]|uniref:LysM peptidoglycan-binding domain-containing protein n=1 Tax=Variovorax sp. PAMC26660 TaxID=2762322 RepID=UPI00164CE85C|nr:LysM peptidoglycan-binding domain-containing protein [Variovorax sp. PAMC26660]QNK68009.1 LysM peptidoglycan-binding domain-containing protein [Variovorax sp. PAMC26660]
MGKLISATYHPNIEIAEFICEDGRHLLRHGGTLPWRINNPGDLTARVVDGIPAPKKAQGYVGFATTRSGRTFLIFPDEEAGRAELKANLQRMHGSRTISEAIPVYAPNKENNTQKYIDDLLKDSGIPEDRKIGDCSDTELEKIMNSISEIEGYHAKPETRKETWVVVSRINATNGIQPLPDTEIILQTGKGEEKAKSDATGHFPVVIHPSDKTAVHVKVIDPQTKKAVMVGTIQGETGRDFNLVSKFRKWKGVAGSEKINSSATGAGKSMRYVVQSGDSLGKIAKLYRTSASQIKNENNRSGDKIFPGEVLLIHAGRAEKSAGAQPSKSSPTDAAQAPRKAAHPVAPLTPPIPSSTESSDFARSKEGTGKVLALINPIPGRAPWMPIAIAEAKLRRGKIESLIEKEVNYHTEIRDGSVSMSDRAWCAAFVNWCLSKANYPIENMSHADRKATMGRAHGFYEVNERLKIRNPLFAELERPIYGAIAMVENSRTGHGSHVGFVYAKSGSKYLILLGGNQGDQINFSKFRTEPIEPREEKRKDGKIIKVQGRPNRLKFFIPTAYYEQAKKDLSNPGIEEADAAEINEEMGIEGVKVDKNNSPRTT